MVDGANVHYLAEVEDMLSKMGNEADNTDVGIIAEAVDVEREYVETHERFCYYREILKDIIQNEGVPISYNQLTNVEDLYVRLNNRINDLTKMIDDGKINKYKYPEVRRIGRWSNRGSKYLESARFKELFLDTSPYLRLRLLCDTTKVWTEFYRMIKKLIGICVYDDVNAEAETPEEANSRLFDYLGYMYIYRSIAIQTIQNQRFPVDGETVEVATEELEKVEKVIDDLHTLGRNLVKKNDKYGKIRSIMTVVDL